ncbi:MAG: hypothetical protein JW741_18045 [Sedimentisphaerales bacterium]|nr:hypothetical protein [Sedimentisphaerales bacterium]
MKTCKSGGYRGSFAGFLGVVLVLMLLGDAWAQDPTRFEGEIEAFESTDLASLPPADPILFVGSSSIRMWTDVAAAFPDYPVMNRGFGGSHMSDLLYYFDRVVAAYDPALILVYEGDNDLTGGKSVDQVYVDYVAFVERVRKQLPHADVAFISVKPSPSRAQYLDVMQQLNAHLEILAADDPSLWYVDVFTPMLDDTGQPLASLFLSDMLHMNAAGYALWEVAVGSLLEEWSSSQMQSFLFDFGPSDAVTRNGPEPNDPENFWNNVTETIGSSATGQLQGIVNTKNVPTSINLKIISPFNASGPARYGTLTSTIFPANATQDSLYSTGESSESPEMFASFKLTGLNRERVYNFTFYASCGPVLDDRGGRPGLLEAIYTVTGEDSDSVAYDPANNWYDDIATVVGIVPDVLGEVTISLDPTVRNNRGAIHLGVMQVDEGAPIVFVEEPAEQTVLESRPATFRAVVEGTPPYVVQWLKDGEPIPDANELTSTIERATLDLDGAAFSVSVSNLMYSATSEGAVLHVVPDVNAPVLLSADSASGLTVRFVFDERLGPKSAVVADNYRVNEGEVEVIAAELEADEQTVTLTLASGLTDVFTVSVSGVRDLVGNEIAVDTVVTGEIRPQVLLFDFGSSSTPTASGPTPDDPANFWNNVTDGIGKTVGGQLSDLVSADNVPTGISLVILSRFNGANTNGTLASEQFPPDATRDSLFGNTETFSGLGNVFPSFKLTGLDPMLTYQFTFYASRMSVGDNRQTLYTVTGAYSGFATLNPAGNIDDFVVLSAIAPTAKGEITISLAPGDANNNSYHFTYLGAMRMEPTLPANGR